MRKIVLILSIAVLSACATPHVVETRKIGDSDLTCKQISNELLEAERFEKEARKERTVTGTNVAAALLFWPALLGTYSNTEEAINAAKDREQHLLRLADSKRCKL